MGIVCTTGGQCLNAGYLTTYKVLDEFIGQYSLRIPNREIAREFQSLTAYYFHVDESSVAYLLDNLQKKNWKGFLMCYQGILVSAVSYFDLVSENSYHTLLLGLLMPLDNKYEIISNKESGHGRVDVMLRSRVKGKPSFLFELKFTKDDRVDLKALAKEGYDQILEKSYYPDMKNLIRIGIAHRRKQAEIYVKE